MPTKVLVIEDDPQTLQLIGFILKPYGYEVVLASSGIEGLRQVEVTRPDVVLLDVMLPDLDGVEVCRRLRANKAYIDLPIVMLTAKATASDHANGLLAGADDYISKPVEPAALVARVAAVLRRSRADQPIGDLLTEIANGAVMTVGVVMAWVLVIDEDRRILRSAAVAGAAGQIAPHNFLRMVKGSPGEVMFPLVKQMSPLCEVALNNRPLIEQPSQVLRELPGGEVLVRGLESIAADVVSILPLTLRHKTLGVLVMARRGGAQINPPDTKLLTSIAIQAAMAIENVRLVRRLEQREKEILRDNIFHQTLINTMGDGLVILDQEARITFVNHRFCRMTDCDASELIGLALEELIYQGETASINSWLPQNKRTTSLETRLKRKQGATFPVLMVRAPLSQTELGDVIVVTDLSEQKARELELMRRTKQLGAINKAARTMASSLDLESIPQTILEEAVQVLGAHAGSIVLIDETASLVFRAVVGAHTENLRGMKVPAGYGVIGWVAQNGKPVMMDDVRQDPRFYRGVDQQTGMTTNNVIAAPLVIARQVIGVLELVNKLAGKFDEEDLSVVETLAQSAAAALENARLVSDLRARALELEKAYAELKEADKLKTEMVQNVSHELRTPLTFILGYVELFLSRDLGPVEPEQRKALDIMHRKCQMLIKIVNDIVTLQKLEIAGLNLRPLSLNTFLMQAAQAAFVSARQAGQMIQTDLPAHDLIVYADEQRLSQVLDNLINNAIKFGKPGGTITLKLHEVEAMARVEVRDTGIGIPSDKLEKIFDRFYQADGSVTRRYGGVGLGLAICREIMEAHRGKIWAESEVGHGSCFTFTLPKVMEIANPPA